MLFPSWALPEGPPRHVVQEVMAMGTPLRSAWLINDGSSPSTQLVICATDHGADDDGAVRNRPRELAVIRGELADVGAKEVLFADLGPLGFLMVVEPTNTIAKDNSLAGGVWEYPPASVVEVGRLLQALGAVAWRAWQEAQAPRLARHAAGKAAPDQEDAMAAH
jgi:hypothetical protein